MHVYNVFHLPLVMTIRIIQKPYLLLQMRMKAFKCKKEHCNFKVNLCILKTYKVEATYTKCSHRKSHKAESYFPILDLRMLKNAVVPC
jgi:hypothetical protein